MATKNDNHPFYILLVFTILDTNWYWYE